MRPWLCFLKNNYYYFLFSEAPPPPMEPPPLMPIFNDYGSQGESSSPGSNSVESTPPRQGLPYRWTEHSHFFFEKMSSGGGKKDPQITPQGGFFGPWSFIILKNSHQDLINEGSNFILSSLEVGHWAAPTQPFLDKLPEIIDFGLLHQSQNRARFWIC